MEYRNFGRTGMKVSGEDRAKVDKLVPPGTFVSPFYQANFGPHEHRV